MAVSYRLERTQDIPRSREEVFAFFSDAANLELITPASLHFQILTPLPIEMRTGAQIDYRLSLSGVPVRWRTRIVSWEPPLRFIDDQERGPYALWRHTHEFEAIGNGTRMRDTVDYRLPFGPLGSLVHALWVRRTVEGIFDYRRQFIREKFGVSPVS
ncbi:MAG TPA: SRPBCC family protein [Polyangiaceae bacterium]|nr:SRPBCC family protein [Polyangiaceae bacterium]